MHLTETITKINYYMLIHCSKKNNDIKSQQNVIEGNRSQQNKKSISAYFLAVS